jgi:hypothetical protein
MPTGQPGTRSEAAIEDGPAQIVGYPLVRGCWHAN